MRLHCVDPGKGSVQPSDNMIRPRERGERENERCESKMNVNMSVSECEQVQV